jgi:anti-sigma factor RsiW
MMKCIDEITLNAYFDGELSSSEMKYAAAHLAACPKCTALANEIEEEIAALSLALEAEVTRPVPTEKLWARIETAVAELPAPATVQPAWGQRLRGWWAGFSFGLQPAVACATLVIVGVGVAWFTWAGQDLLAEPGSVDNLAHNSQEFTPPVFSSPTPEPTKSPVLVTDERQPRIVAARFVPAPRPQAKPVLEATETKRPLASQPALLPGEAGYLKSIASLEKALGAQQAEISLQPGLRAAYERNIAVLDQAIKTSQRNARRNPKDADAAEFLYSSYQSKLDLMTTVASHARPLVAER